MEKNSPSSKNSLFTEENIEPVPASSSAQSQESQAKDSSSATETVGFKRKASPEEGSPNLKKGEYVKLLVVFGDKEFEVQIRTTTKIHKLSMFIADKIDKDPRRMTLLCNGRRCREEKTVGEMDIQEGDVVTCAEVQSGG